MEHYINKVFEIIDREQNRYLEHLREICCFEARAYDKPVIDRMMDCVEAFANNEGLSAHRIPFEKCGDFLIIEINPGNEKAYTLHAHMDTVHEKGVFGEPPVRVQDDIMTGPGVYDCKGGAVLAMLVLKALKESGYTRHLRLLLNTDEEISNTLGGEKELRLFEDCVKGFKAALNCESGRKTGLVTGRKGILRMEIEITGISGHSGVDYFKSANAVCEAAHKIVALEGNSQKDGTTYNCSIISGGNVANIIPDKCSFTVDIRVCDNQAMKDAEAFIQKIAATSYIPGCTATVRKISSRPPMEQNADSLALCEKFSDINNRLGWGELHPIFSGGGSDSAYTQLAGIPSICALGPYGGGVHRTDEYVVIDAIAQRAKLLAAFILEN